MHLNCSLLCGGGFTTTIVELNPDNDTIRETLKQFKSNTMVKEAIEPHSPSKNKEDKAKAKEKAREKAAISKTTAGGISLERVTPTETDVVSSLLNHRSAKLLPEIVQQRQNQISLVEKKQPLALDLLPTVNPNMCKAVLVREEALKSRKKLKKFLRDKVDIVSKGPLFAMLDAASELARSSGISRKRAAEAKKGYSITAMSAVALKQLSQERSRRAVATGSAILCDTRLQKRETSSPNIKGDSRGRTKGKSRGAGNNRSRSRSRSRGFAEMSDELETDDEGKALMFLLCNCALIWLCTSLCPVLSLRSPSLRPLGPLPGPHL